MDKVDYKCHVCGCSFSDKDGFVGIPDDCDPYNDDDSPGRFFCRNHRPEDSERILQD